MASLSPISDDKAFIDMSTLAPEEYALYMSSRKPDGVRIAENDAGFVILPDGKTYYIAVFVTESKMSDSENHALAAQVSEIVYEHIMALK